MRLRQLFVSAVLCTTALVCAAQGSGSVYVYGFKNDNGVGDNVIAPDSLTLSHGSEGASGTGRIVFSSLTPFISATASASKTSGVKVDVSATYFAKSLGQTTRLFRLTSTDWGRQARALRAMPVALQFGCLELGPHHTEQTSRAPTQRPARPALLGAR